MDHLGESETANQEIEMNANSHEPSALDQESHITDEANEKDVVDEKLLELLNHPKFYKALSRGVGKVDLDITGLSYEEREHLFGPEYLNLIKNPASPSVFPTSLSGFYYRSYLSDFDLEELKYTHELSLKYDPYMMTEVRPSNNKTITEINEVIMQRKSSLARKNQLISEMVNKVNEVYNEVYHGETLEPTLDAILKLRLFLALRNKDSVSDEEVQQIANEINFYAELEDANQDKLPVGLEVEIPFAGSTKSKNPSTKLVAYMEHWRLIEALGIPTESDKQGEVALPKSHSIELQLYLLELLQTVGYLPVDMDQADTLRFTLHMNIGYPEGKSNIINPEDYRGYQPGDFDSLDLFTTVASILYSNDMRLKHGAYFKPLDIKGEKKESRVELRTLTYNPHASIDENLQKLEEIRTIATPVIYEYTHKDEGYPLSEKYRLWKEACLKTCNRHTSAIFPLGFKEMILALASNENDVAEIRAYTDQFLQH